MANLLSYSRILLAFLFVYLVSTTRISIALAVLVLAAITDYLDGFLARKTDTSTSFGAVLDPIADRIFILSLCTALLIKFWQQPLFKLVSVLLITREIFVGLGFLWFKTRGAKLAVTSLGKASTAFVFTSFVVIFVLPKAGIYLLLAATALYLVSSLNYAIDARRQMLEKS